MADNPYSPYVDRSGGSVAWGANPTNKRGPQNFPPIPAFKPYNPAVASAPGLASAISRLRTTPQTAATSDAGTGNAGRGANTSGNAIQGIAGIQGIPTLGKLVTPDQVLSTVAANTPAQPPIDSSSPDLPPDAAGNQPGGGNWSDSGANTVDRPTGSPYPPPQNPDVTPLVGRLRGPSGGRGGPLY